jgi:acetate kinase
LSKDILVLNCGSSSAKYQLMDWDSQKVLAKGLVERVTIDGSFIKHSPEGKEDVKIEHPCPTHVDAIKLILDTLTHPEYGVVKDLSSIKAVGHRTVHGGENFANSALIDDKVIKALEECTHLAPLHNPANLSGIRAAMKALPGVPNVAVFDTAFHQTMPEKAYIYAIPYEYYEKYSVRRYGFHGTSHLYVSKRAAVLLGKEPKDVKVITLHIGNGVSHSAVKNGVSVDTSMGLTPLEGAVMGTRSGDIDPYIPIFLMKNEGLTPDEVDTVLNKKSGVLGITKKYTDRRDIGEAAAKGDKLSQLSIDIEAYRIKKYIGAYAAAMGGVDAVVFTAGVGENSIEMREEVLKDMEWMGIKFDAAKNKVRGKEALISAEDSPVKAFVIPTDEELVITEDTVAILEGTYKSHTEFKYSFQK